MKNKHTPVMLEEVESFIPKNKKINALIKQFLKLEEKLSNEVGNL